MRAKDKNRQNFTKNIAHYDKKLYNFVTSTNKSIIFIHLDYSCEDLFFR